MKNISTQCSFHFYLIFFSALYLIFYYYIPANLLPRAMHDDGLFVHLARELTNGNWLGDYSQYTLMKGPGYPLFLALNNWLGWSISFAHALLHCVASLSLAYVITKLSNKWLGGTVFMLTLWHPVFMEYRVLRQTIYPDQTMLFLALFAYSILTTESFKKRLYVAVLAGISLSWFWLTREEGVWILPGMACMILFAMLHFKKIGYVLWPSFATVAACYGLILVLKLVNFVAYDDFVGVDVKEKYFSKSLSLLQSVENGEKIDYVPVSKATRAKIYKVSTAFASLREYFDPEHGQTPWQSGCKFYPQSCGDIAGGWFIWALRDAAASKGHYRSAKTSSDFFRKLSQEVEGACHSGQLKCKKSPIPYMPHISDEQIRQIPDKIVQTVKTVTLIEPPPTHLRCSSGDQALLSNMVSFVGNPIHWPSRTAGQYTTLNGWYTQKDGQWFEAKVVDKDGLPVCLFLQRRASPDLVTAFENPHLAESRFVLRTPCDNECRLIVKKQDGAAITIAFSDLMQNNSSIDMAGDILHIDTATTHNDGMKAKNPQLEDNIRYVGMVQNVREMLWHVYNMIVPAVSILGFIAFILSAYITLKRRVFTPIMALATALWASIAALVVILVLIDVTAFPTIIRRVYLLPLFNPICIAALLSIYQCVVFVRKYRS